MLEHCDIKITLLRLMRAACNLVAVLLDEENNEI